MGVGGGGRGPELLHGALTHLSLSPEPVSLSLSSSIGRHELSLPLTAADSALPPCPWFLSRPACPHSVSEPAWFLSPSSMCVCGGGGWMGVGTEGVS